MKKKLFGILIIVCVLSLTLVACGTSVDVTINFDSNGGTAVSSLSLGNDMTITMPDDPTKDGYVFAGWYWDNNTFQEEFTAGSLLTAQLSKDMTVYAKWISEEQSNADYTVTFNSKSGTAVEAITTTYGSILLEPTAPTRSGFYFGGWFRDEACLNKWNFSSDKVVRDITLYAKWIERNPEDRTYTVVFYSDDEIVSKIENVSYNTIISEITAPTKTGYVFKGWYTSEAYTQKWYFDEDVIKGTTKLYARWVKESEINTDNPNITETGNNEQHIHNWGDWSILIQPTCDSNGEEIRYCLEDNEHFETREMVALGHNYNTIVTVPTCTAQGYSTHMCSRCNDSYTDSYVNALGHDLIHYDGKEATCTETGYVAYDTCSRCDYSTYAEIESLGHNYNVIVTAPTCTEQGYSTHMCSRCNDSYTDSYVNALGHDLIHHDGKEATCTENGNIEYWSCSVCNKKYSDNNAIIVVNSVVTMVSHKLIHYLAKSSTCTEDGHIEYWMCSVCNKKFSNADATIEESNVIIKAGHNLSYHAAKNATCVQNGNVEYWFCSVCGRKYSDASSNNEILNAEIAASHSLVYYAAKSATTSSTGNKAYYRCSKCNKYFTDSAGQNETTWDKIVIPKDTTLTISSCTLSVANSVYYMVLYVNLWTNGQLPSVSYSISKNGTQNDVTIKISFNQKTFMPYVCSVSVGSKSTTKKFVCYSGKTTQTITISDVGAGTQTIKVTLSGDYTY